MLASTVNGITYLVLGGGGASLSDPADDNDLPVYDVVPDYKSSVFHFARIDVHSTHMQVSVIRVHNREPYPEDQVTIYP